MYRIPESKHQYTCPIWKEPHCRLSAQTPSKIKTKLIRTRNAGYLTAKADSHEPHRLRHNRIHSGFLSFWGSCQNTDWPSLSTEACFSNRITAVGEHHNGFPPVPKGSPGPTDFHSDPRVIDQGYQEIGEHSREPYTTMTDYAQIETSKTLLDTLVKDIKPEEATFENACLPRAHDDNIGALEAHIIGFYSAVSTDSKLRDASSEAEKLMSDFGIESVMREDIFNLVDGALKKDEKLDPESRRWLEKDHKSYIRNGLGVPAGPKRDRFKAIKMRLSDISIKFQKTLNEENGGIWLTLEELDGVPQDLISTLKKGTGEHEGKVWLSFKYPDLFPTLKYAKNPATRKKLFIENENKCNDNISLFKEAVILRDEAARILGYNNHAEFRIEDKMAKTPKTVDDFLGDLRTRLAPGGLDEINKLTAMKEADLKALGKADEIDGHYYLWDHRYYDTLMLEKEFALDQNKISEYFPLMTAIQGMFHIFEELFGLLFVEITGEERDKISESGKGGDIVWHEDVQLFSVWDDEGEGSGFVGYLYLDLHPRKGKYGHAANFNLQPGFIQKDGTRRYPATALVCNFSKPTTKKPSLLKHDEVVTLFHELGHGIHDLVSRTIYSRFHGTNTVRDFVEAPSQMLENWCWTPSQLKALSKHYSYLKPEYQVAYEEETGSKERASETIPDDLIDSIIKTKHVNDALFNLRQVSCLGSRRHGRAVHVASRHSNF